MQSRQILNLGDLPTQIKQIRVNQGAHECGILTHGAIYSFLYTQYVHSVSLPMQFRADPYNSGSLQSSFSQNLPEGYIRHYVYERLHRALKDTKINDMFLLGLIGNNGVGSLNYEPGFFIERPKPLELSALLQWDNPEPVFPYLLDKYYLSGMLSGIQPKVLMNANIEQIGRPNSIEGSYIVKSFDNEFPNLATNEYVCMQAAKACGLAPPNTFLSDDKSLFIIERFDLMQEGDTKYALNDFLTLMSPAGGDKYKGSYENVLKAVQIYTRSMEQVVKTYKYIVFNSLIGNGDAHLKNFSLMYDASTPSELTEVFLSPPYDITHTLIYSHLAKTMALKIGGERAFPNRNSLENLGKKFGITKPDEIITEFADKITLSIESSSECQNWKSLEQSIKHSISIGASHHVGMTKANRHRTLKYPPI